MTAVLAPVQVLVAARRAATSARLRAYTATPVWATMDAMSDDKPLKRQLPHPYNQDLSRVITHLNRRTPFGRERLANDPVTAAYIAAATRLVSRHLGPDPDRLLGDPRDENSLSRPLFSFISQRTVAIEVANNPDPFPRQGNVSTLRSTWNSTSDFIADLISFAFWTGNRRDGFAEEMAAGSERLLEDPDVVQAVHDMAYLAVSDDDSPTFRLSHVAMSAADGDKTISDAIAKGYEGLLAPWKEVYAAFIEARGLQLRPGITIDDLANVLSALVDGLTLRTRGNPSPDLIDHEQKRTVLGTAALAMIYAFLEPVDGPSGVTLEQAVHEMIYSHHEGDPLV